MSGGVGEFLVQGLGDGWRDECVDGAPEACDFLDEAGAEVGEFLFGGEEAGFEVGVKFSIHQGHLEFEFEIRDGAQSAHDHAGVARAGEIDEQSAETGDLDAWQSGGRVAEQGEPFVVRKQRRLVVVVGDGDHHAIEQAGGPGDHIEVTIGDRVEAAWVNGGVPHPHRMVVGMGGVQEAMFLIRPMAAGWWSISMSKLRISRILMGLFVLVGRASLGAEAGSMVQWRVVADLPAVAGQREPGLAGVFAGALDRAHAVVAGGTFFDGKGPLEGGMRTFSDRCLVLRQLPGEAGAAPSYDWLEGEAGLPQGLAYGASVSVDDGVLMIGGTDGIVCVADVRLAQWQPDPGRLVMIDFPPLPKPLAYLGAGRVGSWVMVAGGTTSPDGQSGSEVYGLDLSGREAADGWAWQPLPPLPVAVHFPIVIGESGDTGRMLHVLGGRDLRPGHESTVISSGWQFDLVSQEWSESGPIEPVAGAGAVPLMAGTGVALEPRRLLVLGGDDGVLARVLEDASRRPGSPEEREAYAHLTAAVLAAHPGYRRGQLLFDAVTQSWRPAGNFPGPTPAVTPAFLWDGAIVLMGGEPAPGRRSAHVWLGELEAE